MRISDWSSDVCSSDLLALLARGGRGKAIVDLDRLFLFRRADHLRADSQRHQQKGEKGEKIALHHQKLRIMLARTERYTYSRSLFSNKSLKPCPGTTTSARRRVRQSVG